MRFIAVILVSLWATIAPAQTFPDYTSTTVNDFAGLLSEAAEARISNQLERLRADTDIEMTVVTMTRKATYDPDATLEEFATALFNEWGIGDKDLNNGILVLVLHGDREIRIELGAGFGRDWDRAAASVIDRSFLPSFREDQYEVGIEAGVTDTIATIAQPFYAGENAPEGRSDGWLIALFLSPFAAIFAWIAGKSAMKRWRKCPNCGHRTLQTVEEILENATREMAGKGKRTTTCTNCDYYDDAVYTIPWVSPSQSSSSSSSSFGGGRSGGGGASGKW